MRRVCNFTSKPLGMNTPEKIGDILNDPELAANSLNNFKNMN